MHTPLHQVALRDLGAVVAAILGRRQEHLSVRIEIAADAPTPEEMAAAIGVRAVETSVQSLADRNPDLAAMYTFLAGTGDGIDVAGLRARYPEVAWLRFRLGQRAPVDNPNPGRSRAVQPVTASTTPAAGHSLGLGDEQFGEHPYQPRSTER